MAESEEFRFRSYAERYVLARAPTFREGHEDEDSWHATLQAKSAYQRIAETAKGFRPFQQDAEGAQGPSSQQAGSGMNYPGGAYSGRVPPAIAVQPGPPQKAGVKVEVQHGIFRKLLGR